MTEQDFYLHDYDYWREKLVVHLAHLPKPEPSDPVEFVKLRARIMRDAYRAATQPFTDQLAKEEHND